MAETIVWIIAGLALLAAGAELLVRGASSLALRLGIPPVLVGLTVVAYGTSAPEVVVSARSALEGRADIALGNVVGSNIFNILFILGASALVAPLVVHRRMIRQEVPLMIGATALAFLLALGGGVTRWEGLLLLALLAAYTAAQARAGLREAAAATVPSGAVAGRRAPVPLSLGGIGLGLGLLVVGARWFVDGSVAAARSFGVSELVIGLTIVAAGTSLPEVATSLLAALRGERDIAVGNVVGSNIFNILGVLGLSAVIAPAGVPVAHAAVTFDLPVALAAAAACLPIFLTGHRIDRWEGAVFLLYYAAYTAFLILGAQNHDALPAFSAAMLGFVIPITAITVAVAVRRQS